METIYEEPGEYNGEETSKWWSLLRNKLDQPTFSVKDNCIVLYALLGTVFLSFSAINENLLDIFVYMAKNTESIATAYVVNVCVRIIYRHEY